MKTIKHYYSNTPSCFLVFWTFAIAGGNRRRGSRLVVVSGLDPKSIEVIKEEALWQTLCEDVCWVALCRDVVYFYLTVLNALSYSVDLPPLGTTSD